MAHYHVVKNRVDKPAYLLPFRYCERELSHAELHSLPSQHDPDTPQPSAG